LDWSAPDYWRSYPLLVAEFRKKFSPSDYTSNPMLDAGQQIIDATMEAFPHQQVALSIGVNGMSPDPCPNYFARSTVVRA